MSSYLICTDSACDLKPELLSEWGVRSVSLTFRFSDDEKEYSNNDMEIKEFYDRMREGGVVKTAAVNVQTFKEAFEAVLKEGLDVFYLGFSSGLSTTFNSARLAALELSGAYPDRKIRVVDSLCASAGQGLLLNLAVRKRDEGATLDEVADYIEGARLSICHWFTVDDLVYLKRGGRVSPTKAFVGNLLGIKPVLHVDDEGHLVPFSKKRGRESAVTALADKYGELAVERDGGIAYISNADCSADVEYLVNLLKERYNATVEVVTDVGTVIGAHSGPGTLALFFVGTKR